MKLYTSFMWLPVAFFVATSCAQNQDARFEGLEQPIEKQSSLTPGATKKTIVKGKTKQSEILEVFGPPDLITTTTSGEMWGYDRVSRETASSAFGIGVLGGGLHGAGFLGGVAGARSDSTTQTVKTLFLLIYFDKNETVADYKLSATRF